MPFGNDAIWEVTLSCLSVIFLKSQWQLFEIGSARLAELFEFLKVLNTTTVMGLSAFLGYRWDNVNFNGGVPHA